MLSFDVVLDISFESTRTVTAEEFAAWVRLREEMGDGSQYELLNGRIVMNPPTGYPHGEVGELIGALVGNFVRAKKLGRVFDSSTGFHLPSGDTVEPDRSFVSVARWDAGPRPSEGEFIRIVPDLIVEVLSPGNASRDRGEKKAIYERNGVREYWLVDPRARQLTRFVAAGARFDEGRVFAETERVESVVLAGLEFAVRDVLPE